MKKSGKRQGFWGVAISVLLVVLVSACGDPGIDRANSPGTEDSSFDLIQSAQTSVQTRIKSKPPATTNLTTAIFKFTCSAGACTYKCKLDAQAWKKCRSPKTYNNLPGGTHTFKVKATNSSGQSDRTPAKYSWVIKDVWKPTSLANAPSARSDLTAVWTGTEMIVWGGDAGGYTNTGGKYDPVADSWTATSTVNAPTGRKEHCAVWDTANSKMVVWGGFQTGDTYTNTGGIYNPSANS